MVDNPRDTGRGPGSGNHADNPGSLPQGPGSDLIPAPASASKDVTPEFPDDTVSPRTNGASSRSRTPDNPLRRSSSLGRTLAWLAVGLIGFFGLVGLWVQLMFFSTTPPEATIGYKSLAWAEVPGWSSDVHAQALPSFHRSCDRIANRPSGEPFHPSNERLGTVAQWQAVCRAALDVNVNDSVAVRRFFETRFRPSLVYSGNLSQGLMTGYFEPELKGSLVRDETYNTPIRALPEDLVQVDLGQFRDDLRGRRIAGEVKDGRLVPYADRADIQAGALGEKERVLAWVDSPIDAFFLHIQGSGRIRLPDETVLRVGYAGQNGHPYTAIGRVLIDEGEIPRQRISMQSIRAWLAAHPEDASRVMETNASYIFFRPIDVSDPALGPLGSQGVPLAPERSLAIDPRYHAFGMPIWVETKAPTSSSVDDPAVFRRLMIAQDTGGAIRGVVRGDLFFGHGEEAANRAGRMNSPGRFYVLLPRSFEEG